MKLAKYSPPKILRNTLSEWPKNSPTDAASRFSTSEAEKRDQAVKDRDVVASKMTPAQIAEAQRLAREWKPK